MDLDWELSLHPAQWEIFDCTKRFRVSCNGRRFGKTAEAIQELVFAALGFQGEVSTTSPQMVVGCLPTAVQARQILFKPLVSMFTSEPLKHLVSSINLSEMRINLIGKPAIRICGANDKNGTRLRGIRLYFILLDEVQDVIPEVWTDVIRPALADTVGSRGLFTGTPKGEVNILYDLAQYAKTDKEWSFFNFPTSANPLIPRSEIAKAKALLPPRVFEQEFMGSFVNFPGQIYSELDSHNLFAGELPPFDLTVMGVDFGGIHPAISVVGREPLTDCWYWLSGWSPNISGGDSQPIPRKIFENNINQMVERFNVDLIFCDPSQPSDILAIRDLGGSKAYKSAKAGFNPIAEGIGQVHSRIFQKKLKFVKEPLMTGKDIISGYEAYNFHVSYHYVSKRGQITEEPADGNITHICDSTRYAMAMKRG